MNKLLFTQKGNRILCIALPLVTMLFALSVRLTGRLIPFLNMPPCFLKHYTGLECPSCGGTRAAFALFHLDIISAMKYNPIMTVLYLVVSAWFIWFAFNAFKKEYRVPFKSKWYSVIMLILFVSLIAYFIIRNLH